MAARSGTLKSKPIHPGANKWMKDMDKELGFNLHLTTYIARQSFATILVRSGPPISFASQTLEHTPYVSKQCYTTLNSAYLYPKRYNI